MFAYESQTHHHRCEAVRFFLFFFYARGAQGSYTSISNRMSVKALEPDKMILSNGKMDVSLNFTIGLHNNQRIFQTR